MLRHLRMALSLTWVTSFVALPLAFSAELPKDYRHVTQRLEARGASPEFIQALNRRVDRKIQERVIRSNVLGFRLKADYSGHIDEKAIRKCRDFMRTHSKALSATEQTHGVPKEVIAALLWVETRHGRTLGKFDVPSVYMNLAMADHPAVIEYVLETLQDEVPANSPEYSTLAEKVRTVSARKAEWALGELLALQEMKERRLADPFRIKGSYAGAFGMAQFIPSSYIKWAEGQNTRAPSNLFSPPDAIRSVGNFLRSHGWGEEDTLMKQALHSYNRSDAYVNTILTLADRIKLSSHPDRKIASQKSDP